jgi:O-antigen/teichoic acid export membrane protein
MNLIEMRRSLAYYAVLVIGAAFGTAGFTMAIALVVASALHVAMLVRAAAPFKLGLRLSFARFRALTWQLRWIITSAFLFALGMNGDYLVLGRMLQSQELGYYFFGFMLITNVTILLASGINQTLLPIFSRLKNDLPALQRQVLMSSGAITLLACVLSICLIGFGAVMVHLIWGGKWDGAIVVVLSVAAIQPVRLTATMGGVVLEAQGAWSLRLTTLVFDGVLILICSAVGAWLGGLFGAAIAVAVQRALTGLVTFPIGVRRIGIGWRRIGVFWLRCLGPYVVIVVALFLLAPERHANAETSAIVLRAALETAGAVAVFLAANMVFNRSLLKAMAGMIRPRKLA